MVSKKIPETLEEAIASLLKDFDKCPKDEKEEIKLMAENEYVGATHHFGGMHIRNAWNLWHGSKLATWFNERGIFHPDDMSGIIFTSFHRTIIDKPIELETQIKYYRDFCLLTTLIDDIIKPDKYKIKDLKTGEVLQFSQIKIASNKLHIPFSTFRKLIYNEDYRYKNFSHLNFNKFI